MNVPQPEEHIWWLVSRASGLVALGLITVSVLLGLAMAAKLSRRPGLQAALNKLHEQLTVAGLIAIGLHGVTLLGDPWLRPGLVGIIVPGVIDYRTAFVAAGIVGGYLAALLGLSYYARKRIGGRRWRIAHRFVIAAWVLAVVHAVGAGTDTGLAVVRWPLAGSVVCVAVLLAMRIIGTRGSPRVQPGAPAEGRRVGHDDRSSGGSPAADRSVAEGGPAPGMA